MHHPRVYLGCRLSRPPSHPQTPYSTSGSASCLRPNTPSAYSSRATGKAPRRTFMTSTPSQPIKPARRRDGESMSESEPRRGSGRLPLPLRGEKQLRGNRRRREAGAPGVREELDRRGVGRRLRRHWLCLELGVGLIQEGGQGLGGESGVCAGGGPEMAEHCIEEYLVVGFLNIFTSRGPDNHSSRLRMSKAWTFHIPCARTTS